MPRSWATGPAAASAIGAGSAVSSSTLMQRRLKGTQGTFQSTADTHAAGTLSRSASASNVTRNVSRPCVSAIVVKSPLPVTGRPPPSAYAAARTFARESLPFAHQLAAHKVELSRRRDKLSFARVPSFRQCQQVSTALPAKMGE